MALYITKKGAGVESGRPQVEKWDFVEISLEGPRDGNPFTERFVKGVFTGKNERVKVDGF